MRNYFWAMMLVIGVAFLLVGCGDISSNPAAPSVATPPTILHESLVSILDRPVSDGR